MTNLALLTTMSERDTADVLAPVRVWLWVVSALIVVMVLVGGATRLTGSGLSITEWAPVTGVVPPLGHEAWAAEFEKYRQTPQYALVNKGMALADFKTIYLWEWGHRFLGRLIGIVYIVPLVVFIAQGRVRDWMTATLLAVGALGGVQGAVGWIMVASGLAPDMVAVAPLKLMIHLVLACGLLAAVVALATSMERRESTVPSGLRRGAGLLATLVLIQIALGALVAGHHAGLIYNTWPQMGDAFVPAADILFPLRPWWTNFFETIATVQLNHRLGAYAVLAAALWHAIRARHLAPSSGASRGALALLILVIAQGAVGITTLLLVVPLWAALLHQALAVALLAAAVLHWARLGLPSEPVNARG